MFTVLALGSVLSASAQKTKLEEGDFSALKGQTEVNVVFDYSDIKVGRKMKPEAEYLAEKVAEMNQKEPGEGDKYKQRWIAARTTHYAPNFETLIAKTLPGVSVKTTNSTAKYTLLIVTTYTEPGFSMGVSSSDAVVNAEIRLVETGVKDKVLGRLSMNGILGKSATKSMPGMPIDTGGLTFEKRVGEAYEKMGKSLGSWLSKNAMK